LLERRFFRNNTTKWLSRPNLGLIEYRIDFESFARTSLVPSDQSGIRPNAVITDKVRIKIRIKLGLISEVSYVNVGLRLGLINMVRVKFMTKIHVNLHFLAFILIGIKRNR
jgi:hypothetical protein